MGTLGTHIILFLIVWVPYLSFLQELAFSRGSLRGIPVKVYVSTCTPVCVCACACMCVWGGEF